MFGENSTLIGASVLLIIMLVVFAASQGFRGFNSEPDLSYSLEQNYPLLTTKQECEQNGGTWEGKCVYYYSDGGTQCFSSADCERVCILTKFTGKDEPIAGRCAASTKYPSCFAEIGYYKKTGAIECNS